MMKKFRAALVPGLLACSPALASDLYRCDFPDGRVVYQGMQCQIGVRQKAIDTENARREQIQKSLERERQLRQQKSAAPRTAQRPDSQGKGDAPLF